MSVIKKYFIVLMFAAIPVKIFAQDRAKFEPADNKILMIIGQDMWAVGGFPGSERTGYTDAISIKPGGITTYSSLPSLAGLYTTTNYGSGDICAQCIVDNPAYRNSAISIGLYMVDACGAIASGTYDNQIKSLGKWILNANRPVFLRIGYEFDGAWNHYDPTEFKKAWIRIVDIFKQLEVKNCATVWQACTSPVDELMDGRHEDISAWYPGDEYVDWVGYSWFLNSQVQVELTDEILNFARAKKKPVMVCEASPQGYDLANLTKRNIGPILDGPSGMGKVKKKADEIWNEWYVPFFNYIEKNKDVIKVVAYINANWDDQPMWGPPYAQGYWGDSRVEANKFIKTKWIETISGPQWLHASPDLFKQLGFEKEEGRRR
ncbi:MAG: glycosyl hydrolase [Cytophagaceae bacterium]